MPYTLADMTEQHRQIWDWLVSHHAGEVNSCPRALILQRYNTYHVITLSDRKFRQIVSDLVLKCNLPICPNSAEGYYVARYQEELEHGVAELKARASALFDRQHALEKAMPLEPQSKLF